jgi:2-keto-4-pentenoate hydratase
MSKIVAHAEALWIAAATGVPIAPLTGVDADLTVADAYAIQLANVDRALADGRRVVGHKVGLTSKAMQEMLGVDEPDFGVLLDDMVVSDGATVPLGQLLQPRIEAEIGFRLGHDLEGGGVSTADALAAIDAAVPALEIIDSRIADWKIRLVDTVADNGSSAMAVLGSTFTPVDDLDLRLIGVVLERNGSLVEHGVGAAALGHPAACVAWLANKLAEFGQSLRAGQIVLPGALHRAVPVAPGDHFRAEYSTIGTVDVRFAARTDDD